MRRLVFGAAATLAVLAQNSFAATITVPADHLTIQAAVTAAVAGDEVLVSPGTYVENVVVDKNITLVSTGGRAVTTIEGVSFAGGLGAVTVTSGTSDFQLGAVGQGFTVIGVDNDNPGVENAAVYFQGGHSDAEIYDNEIMAKGDSGLTTEYGAVISGFIIDGNTFSGSTFFDPPAGDGFGSQFTLPNVPRQLLVMGCGGGSCVNTTNITFTNNMVNGVAGGINGDGDEQGNNLVTIDAAGSVITGNTFTGTTSRFATSLRARQLTTLTGNTFSSAGLTPTSAHVYFPGIGADESDVALSNTFDKGVYVDGLGATIGHLIQAAVLSVPGGVVIDVLPGDYPEQVIVDGKDLTLRGSGAASTTIQSVGALVSPFTSSTDHYPVVTVMNTPNVVIQDFTVDGLGNGNGHSRFDGVAFWNGGGALLNCDVVSIRETPMSGNQSGVGIYSANDDGGPYTIEVGSCDIWDFQKNGTALSGAGLDVNVHDCVVTGSGPIGVPLPAQNGIQVGFGAGGVITDCEIKDVFYTGPTYAASGLLVYAGASTDASDVDIADTQAPVNWYSTSGNVTDCSAAGGVDGAVFWNIDASATAAAPVGVKLASAVLEDIRTQGQSRSAAMSVVVSGGCLGGTSITGSAGFYAISSGGPIVVDVSNTRVTDFEYGFVATDFAGGTPTLTVTDCFIADNTVAGYENDTGIVQSATQNWWGMADGPSGNGPGTGDAVTGGAVTFLPWRIDGASTTACSFNPALASNEVAATSDPADCIFGDPASCLQVDVDVTRSDNAEIRGFSVDVQLTNLDLCSVVGASVLEGTYLNSAGATVYQVLDNGGGSYTVDCAILGAGDCGQDAPSGTLFTLDVTKGATDGVGTIAVTNVIFRDCDNGPVPGAPGAILSITVDTVAPLAVADLGADQKVAGNDMDGTTAVDMTFGAPGDAASVEVYRAPYLNTVGGNAYPEYDDVAGGVPTAPGSYPPAAPWVLTGVSVTGDEDETIDRGYWYYVMYSTDACGNVSDVSNMTTGVLNYHLGDVTDGITNGDGDNGVASNDISLLGANYGATLILNDPVNYLDVGPTDDFSVNGLPTTDDLVNFEDLIMFAINFGEVSATDPLEHVLFDPRRHGSPKLRMELGRPSMDGVLTAELFLSQPVDVVQGIHAVLEFDSKHVELLGASSGDWVDGQDQSVFFDSIQSDGKIEVDAAALGTQQMLSGEGRFATVRFRVLDSDAVLSSAIELSTVSLRDVWNRDVLVLNWADSGAADPAAPKDPRNMPGESGALQSSDGAVVASLQGAHPNPFGARTAIRFQLTTPTEVSLEIFNVSGRLVHTAAPGMLSSGSHEIQWDGTTVNGDPVRNGIYLYRLRAGDRVESAKLHLQR